MVAETGMSADSPSRQVTVVDVYDLASNIGKDFERLIDKFGAESVTNLMPKVSFTSVFSLFFMNIVIFQLQVISALELLEVFASRNERENEEILGLKSIIERLETEKEEKKEGRQKFEKVCLYAWMISTFYNHFWFLGIGAIWRELSHGNQTVMGNGAKIARRE